ncbi:hypothetical protein B0H14DRAFT_2995804 [Mycena olivaceomarginata]|nr:hypothetical protein B0H14DRAFT_2995804 [Mycena olivaceomarginata]
MGVYDGAEFVGDEFGEGWGCFYIISLPCDPTRNPAFSPPTPAVFAAHARLLSWFPDAPFGVHRMASRKVVGRTQGCGLGPVLQMLVDAFPACGMGVYVAADAALHETEVCAASHSPAALSALHVHASSAHGRGHRSPPSSVYSSSHGHGHGKERKHPKPKTHVGGSLRLAPAGL